MRKRQRKGRGFHEIRLEVRASNTGAIRTYRRLGFVKIAHISDGVVTDGVSEDIWLMSLYARRLAHSGFDGKAFVKNFPRIGYRFQPPEHPDRTGGEQA